MQSYNLQTHVDTCDRLRKEWVDTVSIRDYAKQHKEKKRIETLQEEEAWKWYKYIETQPTPEPAIVSEETCLADICGAWDDCCDESVWIFKGNQCYIHINSPDESPYRLIAEITKKEYDAFIKKEYIDDVLSLFRKLRDSNILLTNINFELKQEKKW